MAWNRPDHAASPAAHEERRRASADGPSL